MCPLPTLETVALHGVGAIAVDAPWQPLALGAVLPLPVVVADAGPWLHTVPVVVVAVGAADG